MRDARAVFTGLGICAVFLYGGSQIYAGYLGIAYHLGDTLAVVLLIMGIMLRLTPIITVGAFFGALDVWHWHWAGAALFAAPGLLFALSATIRLLTGAVRSRAV